MNLNLYDENLNRIAYIGSNFVSCLWSEGYNKIQEFTLELRDLKEYKNLIRPDIYIGRADRKTLMVIKSVNSADNRIIVSGYQAARVLDDVAFVGTIPANSQIETAIYNSYQNSTKYKNIEIKQSGLSAVYESQISNKSFLNLCETMCGTTDVGFRTVRDNGQILLEFYQPSLDVNTKLSEKFGNVKVNKLVLSTNAYKNYAIVLGQGEERQRERVDVDWSDGEDRREVIVDARDLQQDESESITNYRERLAARGVETLLKQQKTWECGLLPLTSEFGKSFDLGDMILVILDDYKMKIQARITRFTQKEQLNSISTTVEVGNITIRR